ncbi:lamin tail domain-containing protein [Streptomyces mirabilis]|uniref:lamin tail domain-containing protein n=1 Tax=Streptomyces mirabilis TaxID=68239 RepID=UPI003662036E
MTVRRLAAATLTVVAVAGAATLPASAADRTDREAAVRIADVQHGFVGDGFRSNRSLNSEWVEVANGARRAVNLSGWTLSDRDGHTYTFHHYRLDGRSVVRVHTGMGRDTSHDLYQDRRTSVWGDRSDTAALRDEHGRLVDTLSWGARHPGNRDGAYGDGRGVEYRGGGRAGEHRGERGGEYRGEHGGPRDVGDRRAVGDRHDVGGRHDVGDRHDLGGRHGERHDGRR